MNQRNVRYLEELLPQSLRFPKFFCELIEQCGGNGGGDQTREDKFIVCVLRCRGWRPDKAKNTVSHVSGRLYRQGGYQDDTQCLHQGGRSAG